MDMQERLQQTLKKIESHGYVLREEWMDGLGGGCVLHGQKLFFSDASLSLPERLEQALDFLRKITDSAAHS